MIFFFDLQVLDIWLFHGITPKFMVIPSTEGLPGYKKFKHSPKSHFTPGLPTLVVFSALLAAIPVWLSLSKDFQVYLLTENRIDLNAVYQTSQRPTQ